MRMRKVATGGWKGTAALMLVLAVAAPEATAQDRSRARTRGAQARTEKTARTAAHQRVRGERAARSTHQRETGRSRRERAVRQGRGREVRTRDARGRGRRSQARAAHRSVPPRQETQRHRRTPVRRQGAKPQIRHRRPKGVESRYRKKHWYYGKPGYRRGGISIDIDVVWPWPYRHRRAWTPRYRYRQVVHVRARWGGRRRAARIDVRTRYHHRVRQVNRHRAEVDIYLDAIELYADGRYLGTVDRIPRHLSRVRATLYRNGRAHFDRELFLVGTPHVGFELIATRSYDGYVLGAYHRGDWIEAGELDLYTGEVIPVRRSRLFRPHDFNGFAPISLLPEDLAWRCDVGFEAVSMRPYRKSDAYVSDEGYYYGRSSAEHGGYDIEEEHEPLRRTRNDTFHLEAGARVDITREMHIARIR